MPEAGNEHVPAGGVDLGPGGGGAGGADPRHPGRARRRRAGQRRAGAGAGERQGGAGARPGRAVGGHPRPAALGRLLLCRGAPGAGGRRRRPVVPRRGPAQDPQPDGHRRRLPRQQEGAQPAGTRLRRPRRRRPDGRKGPEGARFVPQGVLPGGPGDLDLQARGRGSGLHRPGHPGRGRQAGRGPAHPVQGQPARGPARPAQGDDAEAVLVAVVDEQRRRLRARRPAGRPGIAPQGVHGPGLPRGADRRARVRIRQPQEDRHHLRRGRGAALCAVRLAPAGPDAVPDR